MMVLSGVISRRLNIAVSGDDAANSVHWLLA